uniref:Uncharacterized protein n=1 Tax=Micrurus lemniscatus lemniscatus TaxID=129467 RepID=A0A2D4HT73_MICLE
MGELLQKTLEQEEERKHTDLGRGDNIKSQFPQHCKNNNDDNDKTTALHFFPAYSVVHSSSWSFLQLSPESLCCPFYAGKKHNPIISLLCFFPLFFPSKDFIDNKRPYLSEAGSCQPLF